MLDQIEHAAVARVLTPERLAAALALAIHREEYPGGYYLPRSDRQYDALSAGIIAALRELASPSPSRWDADAASPQPEFGEVERPPAIKEEA